MTARRTIFTWPSATLVGFAASSATAAVAGPPFVTDDQGQSPISILSFIRFQLAIGGEIFHQTATVAFGSTDPAATRPTTGFNIGAIYDFDEHKHLLASVGTGLKNASTNNLLSWYVAYQITVP
jgi:hypothetical protein